MGIVEIVKELNQGMTIREIAGGLNTCIIDPHEHYSQTAIWTWIKGTYKPKYSMLEHIYRHAPEGSWMREFALRGMAVTCPTDKGENG